MDSTLIGVLALACATVAASATTPVVVARQARKTRREERKEAAEEKQAEQAAADEKSKQEKAERDEVASALLASQQKTAAKVADVAQVQQEAAGKVAEVAEAVAAADTKLDIIHALSNSQYTAALKSELVANIHELALMHEVIRLNRAAGLEPNGATSASVEALETRIAELRSTVAERDKQQEDADKIIAEQAAVATP